MVCVCVSENFTLFWKRLLCIRKFPCVLEKIVVFPNRLLCSRKDYCVLKKIVVFSKRLLCSEKDCCVVQKVVVFFKRLLCFRTEIELCFAPMGHRTLVICQIIFYKLNHRKKLSLLFLLFMIIIQRAFGVYLGVRTCELFLCFVAIVRVRVYYCWLLCFLCFTSLVSFPGSYTEAESAFFCLHFVTVYDCLCACCFLQEMSSSMKSSHSTC